MTLRLVSGQNAPLVQRVLRFAVADAADLDLSAIVVAAQLTAVSSDDFVFYNQPATAGVHVHPDGVHVDLDGLPAHAQGLLCIVSADGDTTRRGRAIEGALLDAQGGVIAAFAIPWDENTGAVICFELYQRAEQWRVRAVGQGYSGGLAHLLTAHGIEVDEAAPPTPTAGGRPGPSPVAGIGFVEPLDREHPLERIEMIFEDAARSTAALLSARDYAAHRLDGELSAAVADISARTGPAAEIARAAAQQRYDGLIADADARYDADARQLIGELVVIDDELPRSLSSWQSASWRNASSTPRIADGIRLGQVRAAGAERLAIPFCLPLPLRRPLWVDAPSSTAAAPVVSALVLRLLAADPTPPILDVVDLTGALDGLTSRLGPLMTGEVVRSHLEVSGKLAALVHAVDLALLGVQSGLSPANLPARVVVLSDFGHGLHVDDLMQIGALAVQGAAARLSLLIVGADESGSSEPLLQSIAQFCEHLPVDGEARVRDRWAGNEWMFTPDALPADAEPISQFISSIAGP